MASNSLVFSNARVKSMENGLLSNDKITRLSYAINITEGFKILQESNYGGFVTDNPYDYEEMLRAEQIKLNEFVREVAYKDSGLEIFVIKHDYHNLKAIFKAHYSGKELDEETITNGGNIGYATIYEAIKSGNFNTLCDKMRGAADEIIKLAQQNGAISPRAIDTITDKAYYSHVEKICRECKVKSLVQYARADIDMANVSVLLRARAVGNISILKESVVNGGEIAMDTLINLFEQSYDAVADKLQYYSGGKVFAIGIEEAKQGKPLVGYEREWDNYLINIFKANRNDIFSVAPIAGYYLAKIQELKVVRMIMVCLKHGVGSDIIKERLRVNYA